MGMLHKEQRTGRERRRTLHPASHHRGSHKFIRRFCRFGRRSKSFARDSRTHGGVSSEKVLPRPHAGRTRYLFFLVPQFPKHFHGRRAMPRVVVIRESKYFHIARDKFPENLYPMLHLRTAINNRLFPRLRLRLDAFSVAEPADIRKVRGQQVKFGFYFPRSRHPRLVYKSQSHAVLAKQFCKARVQPVLVSNLDGVFVILRELLQERSEPCEKVLSGLEGRFIEIAKLKEQGSKLFS